MEPEIQARIERLYENESLTDNLTDAAAKTLLHWGEQQLCDNTDETLVAAAIGFVNSSDSADPDALVMQAQSFLTSQLRAKKVAHAPPAPDAVTLPQPTTPAPPHTQPVVSDANPTVTETAAHIQTDAGTATAPPAKKKRRARKQKSK